ncbi:MFS transporter [Lentzea cavernae]|uniref:MFS transporter n=1 Tax=Lentzea cavernae TaxID=2020703 RepID=A0ABQ3MGM3_9PSEU|nr:MFS transporter [Lentzea cavernae]GHH42717.1 MFS transporter [Lentzea cavernae]
MTTHTSAPPQTSRQESWAGVASLGLGIFALIMAEFLPASLLPRIADGLEVSSGAAGQAVSVTAFGAAAAALLISAVLPRADRRHVMIGLTLLAVISNLVVAAAPNLAVLLPARLLLGFAIGGFWAMSTAVASHLVHENHLGRALTVISSGVALATVAAVPLGAWLGTVWGWRAVFVLGGGAALVALIAQAATLPRIMPAPGSGLRALGTVLRSGVVLAGLLGILLVFTGHFNGFTYIRPAVDALSGMDDGAFAGLLLVFGAANFAGTLMAGPLADRSPRTGLFVFPLVLGAGMLLMFTLGGSTWSLLLAAALWGFGFGGIPTTVLSWGARTDPARIEQISGIVVTVCSLAVGTGAAVGGVLVDGVSATSILPAGAAAAVAGGLLLTFLHRTK